jgi:hypothetical protein
MVPESLACMLRLAASHIDATCGHRLTDDPPEACWRHPEAGLLCPECSVEHRQRVDLHPWPDDVADEVCDLCGPVSPVLIGHDVDAMIMAEVHHWPPRTRPVPVSWPALGAPAVWLMELCDRCAQQVPELSGRPGAATLTGRSAIAGES